MINVKEFLLSNNIKFGTYALVFYDGKEKATWFTKYNFDGVDWFLESPCILHKICSIDKPFDEFVNIFLNEVEILEDSVDRDKYIDDFIKPMIVNNDLYEILNFQCLPYLPEIVDNIKIISEKECLDYLLCHK